MIVNFDRFCNPEYEKFILGCMVIDNSLIEVIRGRISEDEFGVDKHRLIYNAILKDWVTSKCCTLMSLSTRLHGFPVSEIAAITSDIVSTANWDFYVNEVKKIYKTRLLRRDLMNTLETLTPENVDDATNFLDSNLSSYMNNNRVELKTMQESCLDLVALLEERSSMTNKYLGQPSGWDNLDDILDGIQLGKLIILGARPSVGKTAFSLQLARNLCAEKNRTCIFSLEMSNRSLMMRLLALESGMKLSHIAHGLVLKSQSGCMKINNAMSKMFEYPLEVYDNIMKDENDLVAKIRLQAKKGTKYFIVDHIGLVHHSNRMLKRNEQLDDITQKLLHLAQELNVTIICLCQLKRDAEGNRPTLSDLRDSGTIEQNADICMFLHRARATGHEEKIPTEVIIIKHREGACGTAYMNFIPELTKFETNPDGKAQITEEKKIEKTSFSNFVFNKNTL